MTKKLTPKEIKELKTEHELMKELLELMTGHLSQMKYGRNWDLVMRKEAEKILTIVRKREGLEEQKKAKEKAKKKEDLENLKARIKKEVNITLTKS